MQRLGADKTGYVFYSVSKYGRSVINYGRDSLLTRLGGWRLLVGATCMTVAEEGEEETRLRLGFACREAER